MKKFRPLNHAGACFALLSSLVAAHAEESVHSGSAVKRLAKDGIVKLYGAGGPDTALKKVSAVWMERTGNRVEIIAGPEMTWSAKAQVDADIIWGTSEQSMTAFLETYKSFSSHQVEPIYLRPTIIAVKKGNPKKISKFEDLLKGEIKIIVTEGAGVSNTSGTGSWEDVAGRLGRLEDVRAFRRNIVAFGKGSGASLKAFKDLDADAWITWPDWPVTHSDTLETVPIADDRKIWRDLNVVLSSDADGEAKLFLDFLVTKEAQVLMETEGWIR